MSRPRKHRGIIFVISIVSLAVMIIIGTMFLAVALQQYNDAHRDLRALQALTMAEAGVNYMIYTKQQNPSTNGIRTLGLAQWKTLSATGAFTPDISKTLSSELEGSFAVWLLTVPTAPNGEVYQIVSEGIYRQGKPSQYHHKLRAIILGPNAGVDPVEYNPDRSVFDHAIFSEGPLSLKSWTQISGDAGSNDNVSMQSNARVTGDVYMADGHSLSQNKNASLGGTLVTGLPLRMPTLDFADYRAYASTYNGVIIDNNTVIDNSSNWSLPRDIPGGGNSYTFPAGKIVFVDGDVNLTSNVNFTNAGAIIATGNINISANVTSNLLFSSILLASGGDVTVTAQVSIQAVILASGSYRQQAQVTVSGAIIAGVIDSQGGGTSGAHSTIIYREPDDDIPILPPDDEDTGEKIPWSLTSWENLRLKGV